jgi:hypothetical protein
LNWQKQSLKTFALCFKKDYRPKNISRLFCSASEAIKSPAAAAAGGK